MLVDQTLDPMVSVYFKNIGQTKILIQLIQERNEIQNTSSREMKVKFEHYNLELEEVLLGTPSASASDNKIEVILVQLRDRQNRHGENRDLYVEGKGCRKREGTKRSGIQGSAADLPYRI